MTKKKKIPRAVIYARFSPRPDADESQSVENQVIRCKGYCKRYGYEIHGKRIFWDKNISGAKDLDERHGLFKAIDSLKRKDILVVDRIDRLARDVLNQELFQAMIQGKGAKIEYVAGYNDEGNNGEMLRGMFALIAQYQRKEGNSRTSKMMLQHQKNGLRMGRKDRLPYGYMMDPNDPDEEKVCKDGEKFDILHRAKVLHEREIPWRKILDKLKTEEKWTVGKLPADHSTLRRALIRQGMI